MTEAARQEKKVFSRPRTLKEKSFHFCPGCHHGLAHRLAAEAIDKLDLREKTIGVASVGCSVFLYDYFDVDVIEAPHGRAPAVATGLKRAQPGKNVFFYAGDGDMAAIGTSEALHAAHRGECLTGLFINNTVYGMTGGQMAPTTVLGQRTTTTPYGRTHLNDGYPIKMCEMIKDFEGVAYAARVAVDRPANLAKARKAIRRAFEVQREKLGFALVEVLSACPTDWRMTPQQACERIAEELIPYFPLGVYKDRRTRDGL